jgi:hypothetical protein
MFWEGGTMRTHLPILLAAAMLASPASAATRNFGISSFDRIRVEGPFKVRLNNGVAPFARASGDPRALEAVKVEVQGRTLIVRSSQNAWGGYPGENSGPVEVELGTHELSSAWLAGSGSLHIDKVKALTFDLSVQGSGAGGIAQADVDQLRIAIGGTATALVAGKAGKLTTIVRGVSTLDAKALDTKDADISAEGPANVMAHVTNSAKVAGNGVATITLTGGPSCVTRTSGSATVNGCRSTQ